MSKQKSKEVLESEYQVLVTKSNYDKVKAVILTYDETSIEVLVESDPFDAPFECYLKSTLFHVKKKKKERTAKYETKKKIRLKLCTFA